MKQAEGLHGTNGAAPSSGGQGERCRPAPIHANRHMRVVCIGAGASGIFLAYKLKNYFTDFTLNVFEKNHDIGGTWLENRYPGCACDVPAHNYTYSFEPKHDWSANYASSIEIFAYFKDFVQKYELAEYIKCNHEVIGAAWNEHKAFWTVTVHDRKQNTIFERECDFLINAAGILNNWRWPAIPGIKGYKGQLVHSAAWDESIDFEGKHVGLIGNGSSGIQILPQIQKQAKHVTTFVREPTWVSPSRGMEYHKYTEKEKAAFKNDPSKHLQMRQETERGMGSVFPLFIKGSSMQDETAAYVKDQMIQKLGGHEYTEKLIPGFALGCRRLTPGVNYLESYNAPNVDVVYGGINKITEKGCVTDDGREHELDALICATGFDTTFKPRFPLLGTGGKDLAEEWKVEPRSYMGLAAAGYPNYFMFLGPNCPIGNGPIIVSIEVQGEYMTQFMNRWQKEDILSFSPKVEAVDDFMHQKDLFMQENVWNTNCLSWYKNSAIGKITALWPGSTYHYMEALTQPRYDDFDVKYRGRRFAYFGLGFSQVELNPNADTAWYIRNSDSKEPLFRSLQSTYNVQDARSRISSAEMQELRNAL